MAYVTDRTDKPKQSAVPPVINQEADRALFSILLRYGMASFALALFAMVGCGILYSRYPHVRVLGPGGVVFYACAFLWLAPFYVGQAKQSALRLKFARQYVAEGRWREAAAALGSFDEFGQKSLDRTGEAHYLLALSLDKLGRKDRAVKVREFVIKHRAGSEWANKLSGAGKQSVAVSAAEVRRRSPNHISADHPAESGLKKTTVGSAKGRRRRF